MVIKCFFNLFNVNRLKLNPARTIFSFGRGRGGVHIHEGLGAADVAEGNLAQPLQLDIADTVGARALGGCQLTQLSWRKLLIVPPLMLVQIRLWQAGV